MCSGHNKVLEIIDNVQKMCEWLSHGEWCDVTLLCGGRSFNAHRAVLASVSKFLRHILLSCPSDETTTLIVLPDFDLEAMSSVLYYMYNGEVIVQKHKIGMFLDIIKAMQIYIDCQYLPIIKETVEQECSDFNTSCDHNGSRNIFTLGLGSEKDQRFLNIRKGLEWQSVLQYSQNESDFQDSVVRRQNGSELRKSRLGNLKSPYEDRQRNSFLRDLFIETYPRNGNGNGLTEGVLAISNESYRAPASVLSTNANGEHLSNDGALTRFTQNTTLHNNPAIFHFNQQLRGIKNFTGSYGCNFIKSDMNTSIINTSSIPSSEILNNHDKPFSIEHNDKSLLPGTPPSLDFTQSILEVMKHHLSRDTRYSLPHHFNEMERTDLKTSNSSKVIFNQVLENPWNPRKPVNYRPFRRKDERLDPQHLEIVNKNIMPLQNDNNNNIAIIRPPAATVLDNLSERVSFVAIDATDLGSSSCVDQDVFKCIHCDQVFTSGDALALHMRRHSTTARYTCTECGKTFSQLRNYKYHMSIHRGTKEFAATCTVCGKYFNDRGYLSSHMKIHRNRKEYKCTLCPKSFNQRVAYNMHVRIHTGVKPHVCSECGKAFSRKMLLKQHQRTHSGERPYACVHCDKRFADRSNMTLHLRLHTGVKPFSCSLCPKSFTKKHHLKSHLNFHTGSKPYSCPRCKLAFTQSSNMRTHYKKCNAPDSSADGSLTK